MLSNPTILKNDISTIFIDLGNVILFFDHKIFCEKISKKYSLEENAVYKKIFTYGLNNIFDLGKISSEQFTDKCSKVLGVELVKEEFKKDWNDIFWLNAPIVTLLNQIKSQAKIILVSNTNIWHFDYVKKNFNLLNIFDNLILSFEVGYTKPDHKIYQHALKISGDIKTPEKCVFIDDLIINVRGAEDEGIRGILFKNELELKQVLLSY